MATFKEISATLDSALQAVASKKAALDSANAAASKAATEYQDAMGSAQSLRQQLTESLEGVLPPVHTNVKVRIPSVA